MEVMTYTRALSVGPYAVRATFRCNAHAHRRVGSAVLRHIAQVATLQAQQRQFFNFFLVRRHCIGDSVTGSEACNCCVEHGNKSIVYYQQKYHTQCSPLLHGVLLDLMCSTCATFYL